MSSSSLSAKTQTWVQNSGYQLYGWHTRIEEKIEKLDEAQPVYFQPFHGLSPVYCSCHLIEGRFALLKVPPQDVGNHSSDWFPQPNACWIVTDKRFIGTQ